MAGVNQDAKDNWQVGENLTADWANAVAKGARRASKFGRSTLGQMLASAAGTFSVADEIPTLSLSQNTSTVWSKNTTRTVNVFSGSVQGSETDTGIQIPNVYNRFADIPANSWLWIVTFGGQSEVWQASC